MAHFDTKPARLPVGKSSQIWSSEGYKSAMKDIAVIVDNGDSAIDRLNAIRDWIENNSGVYFD